MGKARYRLGHDVRQEIKAIEKAAAKRGTWASIGGFVGGGIATLLTGGAAAPVVAGMMGFAGTMAGRKLGAKWSGTDIQTAGGGKFKKGARSSLESQLEAEDWTTSAKAALTAGISQAGGLKALLGGSTKAAEGAGKAAAGAKSATDTGMGMTTGAGKLGLIPGKGTLGKLFKSSDPAALAQNKGFGKLIDFRGSTIGKALSKQQGIGAMNKIATKAYKQDPGMLAQDLLDYKDNPKELARVTKLAKKAGFEDLDSIVNNYDEFSEIYDLSSSAVPELRDFTEMGTVKLDADKLEVPKITGLNLKAPKLSAGERLAYDKINKMEDAGYSVGPGGLLPEEYGDGFIDQSTGELKMKPPRPNVPVAVEDDFFTEDIIIEDTDFDTFKDWDEPIPMPLSKGFNTGDPLAGIQSQLDNMPLESPYDVNIPDLANTGLDTVKGSVSTSVPETSRNLTTGLMERGEYGKQTFGVFDTDTSQWAGALGEGRAGEVTRSDFIGGETGPYIHQPGDQFQPDDYPRVNEYLQSDAYSSYKSDYTKLNPNPEVVENVPEVELPDWIANSRKSNQPNLIDKFSLDNERTSNLGLDPSNYSLTGETEADKLSRYASRYKRLFGR